MVQILKRQKDSLENLSLNFQESAQQIHDIIISI